MADTEPAPAAAQPEAAAAAAAAPAPAPAPAQENAAVKSDDTAPSGSNSAAAAATAAAAAAPGAAAPGAAASPAAEPRVPVRAYLEQSVVPLLMQGMMELNRKRPADPIEFLSEYLQKHNPKKSKTSA